MTAQPSPQLHPRRVYSSAGRRRRAIRRASLAAVVLLALVLAWARPGDQGLRSGGKLDLAWPREGQAAVAIEGLGTLGAGNGKPVPIASVAKVMTAYLVL
ncbi:MAG: D-alanyl-D-alanine carboxypeptidase, partial [Actinobacteria bacterium]|nr:D-alanyl-D-alanine carboxypeptidase [Actinomycetota bacterium]